MKVQLMGIQPIKFTDKDTGELVEMTKLHVVSPVKESTEEMHGQRCDAISTRLDCTKLEVGKMYNLLYERPLGASAQAKARLTEIIPVQ